MGLSPFKRANRWNTPPPPPSEPEVEIPEPDRASKPLAGNLSAMGLADLLQNLTQNRKSGILRLSAVSDGEIVIVEGNVVEAKVGKVTGTKAIYRMLSWSEGTFELLPEPDDFGDWKNAKPLSESLESILIEGFRQFDELHKIQKGLPALDASLGLKPKMEAPLARLHPRVLDILQIVIGEEVFGNVLDASPLTDLETSKIVFYLMKKGYIITK